MHMVMRASNLQLIPFVYLSQLRHRGFAAPRPTLRFGETGSALDIRHAPYMRLRGGVGIFTLAVALFARRAPKGV